MSRTYFAFKIVQGGQQIASGSAPDLATAQREAGHYWLMYRQDGPCEAFIRRPRSRTWLRMMVVGPQNPARAGVLDAERTKIEPEIQHKDEGL